MIYWCIDCESSSKNEKSFCEKCNSTNVVDITGSNISIGDILMLKEISCNKDFLQAMIELKEKDIIEYTAKLSQFKSQVNQQTQQINNNKPKCPTCGSTKLSKVSTISKAGSVALWGLFSQKVKKNWHCGNCGYEW